MLGNSANNVSTFAADNSAAPGGTVVFNDSIVFTVGTVGGVTGVTTSGFDITITNNSGAINIKSNISTGSNSANTVFLTATDGIIETTGTITAGCVRAAA